MCGICGFVVSDTTANQLDYEAVLQAMTNQLLHRGPDQGGTHHAIVDAMHIGLGHRRLSIIDLSEMGRQPMFNEDRSVGIVFNGEIYNYQEHTERLQKNGHRFTSKTDTETIIHAYEDEDAACITSLSGMFAFALWDSRKKSLLLARDRLGIKPLFYTVKGNDIAFASELKSLLLMPGVKKELNEAKIDDYLTFGYIPGPDTIFRGIHTLMPGHYLRWQRGKSTIVQYWSAETTALVHRGTLASLAQEYEQLLHDCVQSHLIADVPVGAFLSGGIDSSLVCAIASRITSEPLHTFTIGFSGGGDERAYGRAVATHIGSQHHEHLIEPDLCGVLPRLMWHLEQPLFDNSILPTFLVSEFSQHQAKVVLAGDGGDEPFAGYGWTRSATSIPSLDMLNNSPSHWQWNYQSGFAGLAKRSLFDVTHTALQRYLRRVTTYQNFRHWLYTPAFLQRLTDDPQQAFSMDIQKTPVHLWKERFPFADLTWYLPNDCLVKVDRMSMAHGLEVRVPLLDHRLVEWSLRLPWNLRCRGSIGKVLLRQVAQKYLPPLILKPRKQGFTVPIARWLFQELGETAYQVFRSHSFASRAIIEPDRAAALLSMHQSKKYNLGHRIWSLIVLEIWCRIWLDGQSPYQTLSEIIHQTKDDKQ
ncbi:MAG: asparagine synthase (glutamine-hydrolyzing) [Chitinivibrionales bacterium]|nr:asparagine synthase (glutamine-hydrolyzing) [Chitinivibrionales bacterium]